MKKIALFSIVFLFWLSGSLSFAADTVTSGTLTKTITDRAGMKIVELDWLSDASGNVTATLENINGTIRRVTTNPDDGSTSPTANYDMTLKDQDEFDVLIAQGANLSQSATASVACQIRDANTTTDQPICTFGDLDLAITNAGNAKGGIIRIYLSRIY